MGDALLQKTYTVDCLSKRRIPNDGTVPQYYIENNHEGIVSKDIFNLARRKKLDVVIYIQGRRNKNGYIKESTPYLE